MLGLEKIHLVNALSVILTAGFNTFAVVIFLVVGKILGSRIDYRGSSNRRRIRRRMGSTETPTGFGKGFCDCRGIDHDDLLLSQDYIGASRGGPRRRISIQESARPVPQAMI